MKILLVHGVGHCEAEQNYYDNWKSAIRAGLEGAGYRDTIDFVEFTYDSFFADAYSGPGVYAAALAELAATAAAHAVVDPIKQFPTTCFIRRALTSATPCAGRPAWSRNSRWRTIYALSSVTTFMRFSGPRSRTSWRRTRSARW